MCQYLLVGARRGVQTRRKHVFDKNQPTKILISQPRYEDFCWFGTAEWVSEILLFAADFFEAVLGLFEQRS